MPHSKVPRDHAAARALPRLSAKGAAGLGAAIALTSLIGLPAAAAPQETVLYAFEGGLYSGYPVAGLAMDGNGALYGTNLGSCHGGSVTCHGKVFKLAPPRPGKPGWREGTLHRFTGGDDGSAPSAGLIIDASGALYGTTAAGGGSGRCAGGCGTVFKLAPPAAGETGWTETVLYPFTGGADGAGPVADLTMDASGALYGTTYRGGGGCCGTVFELTPPAPGETGWTETVLHSFTGEADGGYPVAGLIMDASGALYGTTAFGGVGVFSCGTVFKLTPPAAGEASWTENVLHRFKGLSGGGADDGCYPYAGLIMDASGALYGTTFEGGGGGSFPYSGTVFKLTPPGGDTGWTETVLHSFTGGADGGYPYAGLIIDVSGALYGTTPYVGVGGCCGTVFKLTPPASGKAHWTYRVLYPFTGGADGANSRAGLIMDASGALYGTTENGGGCRLREGCGTVFKLGP